MIEVPASAWSATVNAFRSCGKGQRECVVYWVGPASTSGSVTRAVHPRHTATPTHYEVEGAWLTRFWVELAEAEESVRVQVHTHRFLASHSPTDDAGALIYQKGFLSLVIPWFAMRSDPRADAFLAELNDTADWVEIDVQDRLKWI